MNEYKMKEMENHVIRNESQWMEIYERMKREENGEYVIYYGQSAYLHTMKNRGIESVYIENLNKKEINY